jgi:hypothetical protein
MTPSVAQILTEVDQLSFPEKAELTDQLVERLISVIPSEIQQSHLAEVRRRLAQVEAGEVTLVPGEEGLQRVRSLVAAAHRAG